MKEILTISLLMLFLINLVIGSLLAFFFLFRTDYFFKNVFPKKKPSKEILFSKNVEDSDLLVLYYGARFFCVCFFVMLLVLLVR